MNFGKNDFRILLASLLTIILISISFPLLGMADVDVSGSDIPEADFDTRMDVMGDRPEYPRSPTSGELHYDTDRSGNWQDKLREDPGDNAESPYVVFLDTYAFDNDPMENDPQVNLDIYHDGGLEDSDEYTITESDFEDRTTHTLSVDDESGDTWDVRVQFMDMDNWGADDLEYYIQWNIEDMPSDDGLFNSIPIVGGIFSVGESIGQVVFWGVSVFFWVTGWFVELAINAIIMLVSAFMYLFSVLSFVASTQVEITTNAPGLVSLVLIVANVLMFSMVAKVIWILIEKLPTT